MSLSNAIALAPGVMLGHLFYRFLDRSPREVNVKQPPCSGWQLALVTGDSYARRTIVCPFTLQAWDVTTDSYELTRGIRKLTEQQAAPLRDPVRWANRLLREWAYRRRLNLQFDADAVSIAIRKLGAEPPADTFDRDGAQRIRGGKEMAQVQRPPVVEATQSAEPAATPAVPATATTQFKRMKRTSKRAVFVLHALTAPETEPYTVRHYMDKFGMTRNNVLSYWWGLNTDQGVGYTLVGDSVQFQLPVSIEELLCD